MTKRILITGSDDRVESLAKTFAARGVTTLTMQDIGARTEPIDCYIQLGLVIPTRGETIVRRAHSFLSDGLLERFTLADRVLPMLADDATVLLVSGNLPDEVAAPDDHTARIALLHVLAHAIRADFAPRKVRVRVVTGARSDEEIADYAVSGRKDPDALLPVSDAALTADGDYEVWRVGVLGLAQVET